MGLVYWSVVIHPCLSFIMVTSKKCTSESLMSDVKFTVLWMLFRSHMMESNIYSYTIISDALMYIPY